MTEAEIPWVPDDLYARLVAEGGSEVGLLLREHEGIRLFAQAIVDDLCIQIAGLEADNARLRIHREAALRENGRLRDEVLVLSEEIVGLGVTVSSLTKRLARSHGHRSDATSPTAHLPAPPMEPRRQVEPPKPRGNAALVLLQGYLDEQAAAEASQAGAAE